jgi:dihydroorotate dehydrogenase (NAD+) catalytic subunit
MNISIGKLKLKNPVMVASGTFGYGLEFKDLVDLDKLGAIVTKTITLKPRQGNPQPRIFDVQYGMINSIGLQNVGLKKFVNEKLPELKKITKTPIIVSIAGETKEEFLKITETLNNEKIEAIEMNISCPNMKGKIISQEAAETYKIISAVRKKTKHNLIAKLSPAVTDITKIAKFCEDAGSDAISLINSFPVIFYRSQLTAHCSPTFGGLSGHCIKHIALRLVYLVSHTVKIPVIGMGGIMNVNDALEFFKAGAKAIAIGCANFVNPKTAIDIIEDLKKWN